MAAERVVNAVSIIVTTRRAAKATDSREEAMVNRKGATDSKVEATDNKVEVMDNKAGTPEVTTTTALAHRAGMVAEATAMAVAKAALIKVVMQDHSKVDMEATKVATEVKTDGIIKRDTAKTKVVMEATKVATEVRTDSIVKRDTAKAKAVMDPTQELHTAVEEAPEVATMITLVHCITLSSTPETAATETCSTRPWACWAVKSNTFKISQSTRAKQCRHISRCTAINREVEAKGLLARRIWAWQRPCKL